MSFHSSRHDWLFLHVEFCDGKEYNTIVADELQMFTVYTVLLLASN